MKSFAASLLALSLAIIPAQAQMSGTVLTGFQFYNRCTNPPPDRRDDAMAVCAAYVAGIADDMTASRQVCMGPGMTAERLLPVALGWIHFRAENAGYPASVQIRTGLHILYPCQRGTIPVRDRVNPDQVIDRTAKVLELMKLAHTAMLFLH